MSADIYLSLYDGEMARLRPRFRVWKEIFWKPWLGVVAAVYSLLQLWQFIRGELRPDLQEPLRIFHLMPSWSWQTWVNGWLLLFLIVTLEGAYQAIARRDRSAGGAGRRLTELRERAINDLLNRSVRTHRDVDILKSDIQRWVAETLSVLEQCATPSEVSSFHVLGSFTRFHFTDAFNPDHDQEKLMLSVRLKRLDAISRRLDAEK